MELKTYLDKALITPDILSFAEASPRLFKNVPDIFVQRMVVLGNCSCVALMSYIHVGTLLKSITPYKSFLNQPLGRFAGTVVDHNNSFDIKSLR
ncbi:hypothetical protein [Endozoicomonas sp. G2_1]|uniref:hypothetical protein n=1 Tax=Endozoicomonas sp. G2_1 TaxID=2821091 RepID=UPI001ADD577B|nr:hypothetical protein [Endozoicomonas sp. G2_1]